MLFNKKYIYIFGRSRKYLIYIPYTTSTYYMYYYRHENCFSSIGSVYLTFFFVKTRN